MSSTLIDNCKDGAFLHCVYQVSYRQPCSQTTLNPFKAHSHIILSNSRSPPAGTDK